MWKWITGALSVLATGLAALFYRSEAKRHKQRADAEEAESEAMGRQSKAAFAQQEENRKRIDEIHNGPVDRDHFNRERELQDHDHQG